ncbi:MAG: ABC transporter ATP-binding protein [Caldimicrobium sp.]
MSYLLQVKNLTVNVRTNQKILLKDISFYLKPGEILGILGESGSGKSLTAYTILGLLPKELQIQSGEILFEGKNLLNFREEDWVNIRGKEISIIFQDPLSSLNPVLTVEDQLKEVVHIHLGLKGKESIELMIKTLQEVGIPDPYLRLKNYPHELSGGLRQRVMIAMAIICSPKILVADEPTTALDLTIQLQIIALLKKLNQERNLSIIFITHDLGVLRWLAERILVYYRGEILESAKTEALFQKPLHPYTRLLFSCYPGREDFSMEVQSKNIYAEALCSFYGRCVHPCKRALEENPKLLEVEPDHFVRCFSYG